MLGLYDESGWLANWRIASVRSKLPDEYAMMIRNLCHHQGQNWGDISGVAVSSVVPSLTTVFVEVCRKYLNREPLVVNHQIETGVRVLIDYPAEAGADRICNSLAAHRIYGSPAIVVDVGTATTFDVVSADGDYIGGAIAPGLGIAAEALFSRTAKLPHIELVAPSAAIGRTTQSAMQSGLIFGYVGLIEGLITRIRRELGGQAKIIGTGGLATILAEESRIIEIVDQNLTLEGLRLIYELNRGK